MLTGNHYVLATWWWSMIMSVAWCKTAANPLLKQWSYCSLVVSHGTCKIQGKLFCKLATAVCLCLYTKLHQWMQCICSMYSVQVNLVCTCMLLVSRFLWMLNAECHLQLNEMDWTQPIVTLWYWDISSLSLMIPVFIKKQLTKLDRLVSCLVDP